MTDHVQHWQTCPHLIVSGMMDTNEGYEDFTPVANAVSQNYSTVQKSFYSKSEKLQQQLWSSTWCVQFLGTNIWHIPMIISIYYVFHNEGEHAGCIWCVRLMGQRRRCAGSSTRLLPKSTLADIEMCTRAQEQHSYISTRQYRSVNSSFRCKACLSWNLLLWSRLVICIKKSFVMQLLCSTLYTKKIK